MRLERFYADNYRCLVNFELKPAAVQLLVGVNGSGKTTVFNALDGISRFISGSGACSDYFGDKSRTRWQAAVAQTFEVDATEGPHRYEYKLIVDEGPHKRCRVQLESLNYDGKPLFNFKEGDLSLYNDFQNSQPGATFGADWLRSGLALVAPRHDNTKLTRFKEWVERLRPVQIDPWAMSNQSDKEAAMPSRDLSNFADWYRHLSQENIKSVADALDALKVAVPGLDALNARKAGLENREIVAAMRNPDGSIFEVGFRELSDGQRCLIALYLMLQALLSEGSTLLIDEPENFVALREIQPWVMKAMERTEETGGQLILASHHPELLNQLAAHGALVLSRSQEGFTRVKPFPESELAPAEVVASGWEDA